MHLSLKVLATGSPANQHFTTPTSTVSGAASNAAEEVEVTAKGDAAGADDRESCTGSEDSDGSL